jgi:hypothetical protein
VCSLSRTLLHDRPDLTWEKLDRTRRLMDEAVLDCLVSGHMDLVASLDLPDPDDRHVLAAAIHAGGDAIVTFNLKDFPANVAEQYDLEILHPDDFIRFQFDLDNAAVILAAKRCRERLQWPAQSSDEYLDTLARQRLPKTVAALVPFTTVL